MDLLERILDIEVPWVEIDPTEKQLRHCLICGNNNPQPFASIVINNEEFFLVRCERDKLMWLNPQPGKRFLKTLYSEAYYQVNKYDPALLHQVGIKDITEEDKNRRETIARKQIKEWMDAGIYHLDQNGEKKKLLEIGGGRGYLQKAAEEAGWDTLGLEISPYGIKAALNKRLNVLPITLEDLTSYIPSRDYFSVVAMYDFIEHATDPGKIFRLLKNVTREDTILAIRTPNTNEEKGPRLHLIDHLWHFSERSLSELLRKEGYEVFQCFESGIFPPASRDYEPRIVNMTLFAKKRKS